MRSQSSDKRTDLHITPERSLVSPKEYIGSGGSVGKEIYSMTDGVTDTEFDTALEAAKEERNPSRANVLRKIKEAKGEEVPEPSGPGSTLPEETRAHDHPTAGLYTAPTLNGRYRLR
ncbi:MAG: hypothetical protein ACTIKH_02940 [Glutamicibacter ardleyensis]|uniref:hypothetical protein n=1 Tax=Glutamicibacter ardleyensis TaxID=225894 RepID=UPI003F992662